MPIARVGQIGLVVVGLGAAVTAFQVVPLVSQRTATGWDSEPTAAGSTFASPASSTVMTSTRAAASPTADSAARQLFEELDNLLSGSQSAHHQTTASVAPARRIPDPDEQRRAEEAVTQARADLHLAQAEQVRALASPDALARRLAEREVAAAEAMVSRAEAEVNRLSGPNPAMLAAAEREVLRAEATLRAAMTVRSGLGAPGTGVANDAAVQRAWLTLQDAVARHDQIRSGPPTSEVDAARVALSDARSKLQQTTQRLEIARRAWPSASIDEANAAVIAARSALVEAEARLREFWVGSP